MFPSTIPGGLLSSSTSKEHLSESPGSTPMLLGYLPQVSESSVPRKPGLAPTKSFRALCAFVNSHSQIHRSNLVPAHRPLFGKVCRLMIRFPQSSCLSHARTEPGPMGSPDPASSPHPRGFMAKTHPVRGVRREACGATDHGSLPDYLRRE